MDSSKRWIRILPIAVITYTLAYLDRTNISMALPAMCRDFGMAPQQAGNVAGVFFWGYLVLQIPGGYLAHRWSAKWVVGLLMLLWGVCAVAGGLVRTQQECFVARLFLGVTEGGVFPAILVLLSNWFSKTERARSNAYWMLCQPIALILSAPLSGYILSRWNWRVLLIAEGALPLAWLVVWMVRIDDRPEQARWLSAGARECITVTLRREVAETDIEAHTPVMPHLFRPFVWQLALIYFLLNWGGFGLIFWLPTVIGGTRKLSSVSIGLVYSLPFVVAGVMMVLNSRDSDRTGERRNHVAIPLALGGTALFAAVLTVGHSALLALVFVCLAGAAPFTALAPFWALPTDLLPRHVVGTVMGLVSGVGSIGGYCGTFMVGAMNQRFGDFRYAFSALSAVLVAAGWLTLLVKTNVVAVRES